MSQENQSCLRFSLEESLWFRKGQEVEELVSISLDPDITIQENDQYVTIRGSLQLTGEYKSYETIDENEEENGPNQKFVERVEKQEAGVCEFTHRFPVDITIPNNRIQSIYDIDVLVESFDYSLVDRSCLKLSAELTISGLYDVQQQEESFQYEVLSRNEEEEQVDSFDPKNEEFLFEAEARKQQEEEETPTFPQFPSFTYQAKKEEETEEEPSWQYEEDRNEGQHPTEIIVEQEMVVQQVPDSHVHVEEEVVVLEESSSSSEEEPPKQKKKIKPAKKKSMTLTEFFARKDESSAQAKLKVCIVQKGDTVDSLAERYDVSVQNLLRVNNLEINQDVIEGQVLYIPAALAKK